MDAEIKELRKLISIAATKADVLSRKKGNYMTSKTLNILSKELDVLELTARVLSGEVKKKNLKLRHIEPRPSSSLVFFARKYLPEEMKK